MAKISLNIIKKKTVKIKDIKESLEKNHKGYILITCSHPTNEGKMDVELNYSGNEDLVSYLLDSAKNYIEKEFEENSNLYVT